MLQTPIGSYLLHKSSIMAFSEEFKQAADLRMWSLGKQSADRLQMLLSHRSYIFKRFSSSMKTMIQAQDKHGTPNKMAVACLVLTPMP